MARSERAKLMWRGHSGFDAGRGKRRFLGRVWLKNRWRASSFTRAPFHKAHGERAGHALGRRLPLVVITFLFLADQVQAQVCTFSTTDIDFGNVDMVSGRSYQTSTTIRITCYGTANSWIILCPNINAGSGGVASGGDPRYLVNGTSRLGYNLYWPDNSQIWGSYKWSNPQRPPVFGIYLSGSWWFGYASGTITLNAQLPGGQTQARAGVHTSQFSGTQTQFEYGYYNSGVWCNNIPNAKTSYLSFTVRANNQANCQVSATDIDFGTTGVLSSNVDAKGSIRVRCTAGVNYQIGLNGGLSGATDPTQRRMSNGSHSVIYGIYRDAAHTQPWGDQLGVNTVAATATGTDQVFTTYGRVPPQPTPPAGTYRDTIVVTVTY